MPKKILKQIINNKIKEKKSLHNNKNKDFVLNLLLIKKR